MVGITSLGIHLPVYRLERNEIARMWAGRSIGGSRAVAGCDEDTVTMVVAAGLDCLKTGGGGADGLFLATTTAPYQEKQAAAIAAAAADLPDECHTADFTGSLRAATIALKAAVDAVRAGSAENVLVAAADSRPGAMKGALEQNLGDGAAALTIGSRDVIAEVEGSYSIFNDFTDFWRAETDRFVRSAEGRFVDEAGYLPTMQAAVAGLLKKYDLDIAGFAKVIYSAADARQHAALARRLKLAEKQTQDPLYGYIGNTGTPAALLMLAASLETAAPGDRLLLAGYGDGADVFVLRVTEAVKKLQAKPLVSDRLAGRAITYGQYLTWRGLIPVEASTLPERTPLSLPARWRERRTVAALYGARCRKCGMPQISQIGQAPRVCVNCQARDDFEPYKFSDKKAVLFSYAIDQLQPTLNPPGVNGVIDFEGGGRLIVELTDCEVDKVRVGLPVAMTYRKMFSSRGLNNYFWKAKPAE
jgi:hydroxymethylglutaryl-CoA synthase